MSGAEPAAIIGLIASIISIVDGAKQVYDAASNTQSLPQAFREVAAQLPLVKSILTSAYVPFDQERADESTCKEVRSVLESCRENVQAVDDLFQKVIPGEDANIMARYRSAARRIGKRTQIEILMKRVLENIQLLAANRAMNTMTVPQKNEIAKAITAMAALPPFLPEHATDETSLSAVHSGSGSIFQAEGDQYNNSGGGRFYHAQSMNFGKD